MFQTAMRKEHWAGQVHAQTAIGDKKVGITILNHDDDAVDFVELLKDRAIHYVSVAMPGLTVVSANIEFAGGFNIAQRNDLMMAVNRTKETGSLYPKVNITLLPSPSASYGGLDSNSYNNGDYSEEEVVIHILDAFKANSQYIKSDTMYFDFRDLCVSEAHYVSCLRTAMDRLHGEHHPVKVITWEPSNEKKIEKR